MRRIQVQSLLGNRSFSIKLNSNNQTFKTPISKVDNSVKVTTKTDKTDSTSTNTSSNLKI